MDAERLEEHLQAIDEALRRLAVYPSESDIVFCMTRVHQATANALKQALQETPSVPDEIKEEVAHGRPQFPSLVNWAQRYFPHVVDDMTARMLLRFNDKRNDAVHGREDPLTGRTEYGVPSAEDLRATAQSIRQTVEGLAVAASAEAASRPEPQPPARAQFPGQRADEKVVFKLRRHWFVLFMWLIPAVILFLATAGIGIVVGITLSLSVLPWVGLILLLSLLPLGLFVWRVLDWENDHYILTTQRILHIERVYFLFESREEAPLSRIQDVSVEMPTLTANLLYFGDVVIETAATAGQIKFRSVPKPRKVQRLIFREAGLPEPGTPTTEEWQPSRSRALRPLETFTRMLYAVVPQGGGVVIWRKHWYVLLTKIIRPLIVATLLLVAWIVLLSSSLPAQGGQISELVVIALPALFFLLVVGWLAWITIDWHNDLYVLTDTHVIDIEKRPFTMEFRREANLGMIQNVSYEQPGFIPKLLGFGNTRLETAGRFGEFTFDNVPAPRQVQKVINGRLDDYRRRQGGPAPRTREELERVLEEILDKQYDIPPQQPDSQS